MPETLDPSCFLPGASQPSASHLIQPTPPSAPVLGRPVTADARLTVRASGNVTLSKTLLQAIPHLKGQSPIDVVPPMRRGGIWYLDTRPTAPRRLPMPGKVARFTIPAPSKTHFVRAGVSVQPGRFGGAVGTVGEVGELVFQLGPEVAGHPGYYELLPVR